MLFRSNRYLPERLRRYRSDTFNDKYKRLDWDDLSRTITAHIAKDGYWYIHPAEHRTLTVREAARIQTFADDFRFAGTRSDAFRQIGNAVPPSLGKYVAEAILPLDFSHAEAPRLPVVRDLLGQWAKERRAVKWWCYPGPEMTQAAAAVASMLNVHRMPTATAEALMMPLRGAQDLSFEALQHIEVQTLSPNRRRTIRTLRECLIGNDNKSWAENVESVLGEAQRRLYSLLQGADELIVNAHVSKVVAFLMNLPDDHTGLRTDIKVALAQLVSRGNEASLRMCAIRDITVAEARARIASDVVPESDEARKERVS